MNNNWVHNCVDFCMNNVFHVHMYIQFILSRIGLLAFLVPLVIFLRCVTYTLCYIQAIQQFKLTHCKVSLHLNSWSNILTISTQNLVCCCFFCCFLFVLFFVVVVFFCIPSLSSLDLVIQHLKFSSAHTQIHRQHDYSCTSCIFLLPRSSNYKLYKFCHVNLLLS